MIQCPQCQREISEYKFLFKSDYSIVECDNCGKKLKIKRTWGGTMLGGILGGINGIIGYLALNFWGIIPGLAILLLIIIIEIWIDVKLIDKTVEIIHQD